MERLRRSLSALPSWIFSVITLITILWLTLAPKPLGEEPPRLFEGADKIVHVIMFGGFVVTMLLDWQRRHHWKPVWWTRALVCAILSSLLGTLIEVVQDNMGMGRGFEYADIIADTTGAFVFAVLWMILQGNWMARH